MIRSQLELIVKTALATAVALITAGNLFAAGAPALRFGGERIGVPPLSLAESIAQGAAGPGPLQFGTKIPPASGPGSLPPSPRLVPPIALELRQLERSRATKSPRVSRSSGIPIIEPSDAVDYKLTIVPPNPAVDFTLVIKDPRPTPEVGETR